MKSTPQESAAVSETVVSTGTVSRALSLLTVIADAGGTVTVKYVAETMQLPTSTAHRLLTLLRTEGFLESTLEGRQYTIGRQFYRVAARVLASVPTVDIIKPVLEEIAAFHNESVLLGLYLPAQRAMCFVARADGQQKLKYQIDMNVPMSLVWGSSGKAVLAHLPHESVQDILAAEGPSVSGSAPPTLSALEGELQLIRDQGFALSEGQKLADARGIAAPVFGPAGVVGCICLTSPKSRPLRGTVEAVGKDIALRARAVSRDLGATALSHD